MARQFATFILCAIFLQLSTFAVTQTYYSEPILDGSIRGLSNGNPSSCGIDASSLSPSIRVGSDIPSDESTYRGFVSFNVPFLQGTAVESATLHLYQASVAGNPYTVGGPIVVDLIEYGASLEAQDYCASATIANVGTLSTNPTSEVKSLDVTTPVKGKIGRGRIQFRLRFQNEAPAFINGYAEFGPWESGLALASLEITYKSVRNLKPFRPAGWSAPLVTSARVDTNKDDVPLPVDEDIYVDWALMNDGTSQISQQFLIALDVNGVQKATWSMVTVEPGGSRSVKDFNLGKLPAGEYTLKLKVDSENDLEESDENDNTYTKQVTVSVIERPDLTPSTPLGWSAPLVISNQPGTPTDSQQFSPLDTLYVDFAIQNIGSGPTTGPFSAQLLVNDNLIHGITYDELLAVGGWLNILDLQLGPLSPGTHSIRLVIDNTQTQLEADETNNEFLRTITVTPTANQAPTASAGEHIEALSGQTVTLEGSGSDPDGNPITYSWIQKSGPPVVLVKPRQANSSFVAPMVDEPTILTFELTVSDGLLSAKDAVTVTVLPQNLQPTADAGPDQEVFSGQQVALSGSGTDPDGDDLTYSWNQTDIGPETPAVELSGSDSMNAAFLAPTVGEITVLSFRLTVDDNRGGIASDSVNVTVRPVPEPEQAAVFPFSLEPGSNYIPQQTNSSPFDGTFVGVAVVNPNAPQNSLVLNALKGSGAAVLQTDAADMPGRGQTTFLMQSLFQADQQIISVLADGEFGPIRGFFMVGDHKSTKLDGIGGRLLPAATLYFPIVRVNESETTHLFLFNPEDGPNQTDLEVYDPTGEQRATKSVTLPPMGTLSAPLQSIFGNLPVLSEGYVKAAAQSPIQGYEFVGENQAFSGLPGQTSAKRTSLIAPHFFISKNGGTTLRLLNTSDGPVHVELEAFDDSSNLIGEADFRVERGQLFVDRLADILEIDPNTLAQFETVSGYITLSITGISFVGVPVTPKVIGALTFSGENGQYVSTLPLIAEGRKETLVLHVAQSAALRMFTGLAILNPTDGPATVKIEAYDSNGNKTGEKNIVIQGGSRVVDLLGGSVFLGETFEQIGGHLKISCDIAIVSFALFGDFDLKYLSAIEGQAPPASIP